VSAHSCFYRRLLSPHEKGFYRKKRLIVRFAEASPRADVVDEVTRGRAQYGIGTSALLIARNAGKGCIEIFTPAPGIESAAAADRVPLPR